MRGGLALLGIVDALCPSVGQRDKEGSIRKQKRERNGTMWGPSVSIKTHTAPKNPWKQALRTKDVLHDYMLEELFAQDFIFI